MKTISAGVLVYYENRLLACVPFGNKGLDIPKGQVEENESYAQAAIRELFEETGIKVEKYKLKDLGMFSYMPTKDLYLFAYNYDFNPANCKCSSFFIYNGRSIPEVVGYKSVDFRDVRQYYKSLQPLLKTIIERGDLYDNYI